MLPKLPLEIFTSSRQLLSGAWANAITNLLTSSATGITATPGGTAISSLVLNNTFNEITVVATANDSVTLPLARAGLNVYVTNSDAADSLRVFSQGTDYIKASGTTQVDINFGNTVEFICIKNGVWKYFTAS